MKFYEILVKQLKNEPNFVTDKGELKKWLVIGKAQDLDDELIALLLDNQALKEKFFKDIKGTLVFNQNLFLQFLEQKNYLNDSYTQYKNKVGLSIGGKYLKQRNEVALVWPFKDCILEGGQNREEQKRDEIFFNEILAQDEITQLLDPKALSNAKVFDQDGEHAFSGFTRDAELNQKRGLPEKTITDNLIIKGNNLLALHSLKREFAGKVKLIYIDPPYNTGGDANIFTYNNTFNHSSWLTFMKNRLAVAKEFLRNDGVIAVAIDDCEQAYIKIICDEIFNEKNFMGTIIVRHFPGGRTNRGIFATTHEYCHYYAKNIESVEINSMPLNEDQLAKKFNQSDEKGRYRLSQFARMGDGLSTPEERPNLHYPIYCSGNENLFSLTKKTGYIKVIPMDSTGKLRVWRNSKDTFLRLVANDEIIAKNRNGKISLFKKVRETSGIKPPTIWYEGRYSAAKYGTALLKKYFDGENKFSFPKSLYTVLDTVNIITNKNDIVLDFFAGSGTTGHAVLELNQEDGGNRQFILVEQLDAHIAVCQNRLSKVMQAQETNDFFVYTELKKYNQTFIEQIEKAKNSKALLEVWEQIKAKSFLNYNVDIKKQEEHLEDFKALSLEEQKQHLCELLDKNQLYVNLSSLNDKDFACTEEEKALTQNFYQLKTK